MRSMNLNEFETAFDVLWREQLSDYDPETDHWTKEGRDNEQKQQCRDYLLDYARQVQELGISRRGKNQAQRLWDQLGLDPSALQLPENIPPPDIERGPDGAPVGRKRDVGRIMYIECKAGGLTGDARIGRVQFSKSGRTLKYGGRSFRSLNGAGFKSNYYCVETGEEYWISGPKRDGSDRLYGERVPVYIDEDVREEYWTEIRGRPELSQRPSAN